MLHDAVQAKGRLTITLVDESGQIKDKREIDNLVVAVGKAHIAERLAANTAVVMSHMAIGTSNTAPSSGQTALGTELARTTLDTTVVNTATVTYSATFPAGTGTGTLTEAGIFNSANVGTMLCRTRFNPVVKAAGEALIVGWNVTIQ